MNLRDLRYICAVAELRHFGKAAERIHVSQPTLSGQIRKLEDTLGVALFERTNKSVRITPAGERIVDLARQVLQGADEISRVAQAHCDPLAGPMRLGMIPTVAPYLIPLFVRPLQAALPDLKPVFIEEITDSLLAGLERGDLDAAILATEPDHPRLLSLPLYHEPFWVAVPLGHELEHREKIRLQDLDPGELMLLADGHCFRDQALAVCGLDETAERPDTTATSLETIVNLVAAGHGITLVPALAIGGAWTTDQGVIARSVEEPDAARTVSLVHRPGYPREALLRQIAAVIRDTVPNTVTAISE